MAQIDSFLKKVKSECTLNYSKDIYELYNTVPNEDLQSLLAIYHTQLNHWFEELNNEIVIKYDDVGEKQYLGGRLYAQGSRDFLSLLNDIDKLRTKCSSTEYAFRLDDSYDAAIRRCRRFLERRWGSDIPKGFSPIETVDLSPIFHLTKSIAITEDKKTLYPPLQAVGEGSYAQVFSYTDPRYDIPVILKKARPGLDNKEIARFRQEFYTLKRLHSPYIVEAYAYDCADEAYTMECMDESIYDYIRRERTTLAFSKRQNIITQICRGLSYIHSKNLLHRDISPRNVLVKHYEDVDVVKICDFGLVKSPESTMTSMYTEIKGSLNDPDLIHVGFENYEMCHETYAITRLCYFILTGRTNIEKQKEGAIKRFWDKGTNTDRSVRFTSAYEIMQAVQAITEENK